MDEIWKDIPSYEGKYQASNLGRIKSLERKVSFGKQKRLIKETILKPKIDKDGYLRVSLSSKKYQIHKLIAISFLNHVPCGLKTVINHKNFLRNDNNLKNLELIPNRENTNQKQFSHSSKFTGVYWEKNKWRSQIRVDGKIKHLGQFDNEKEASEYYENALIAIHNGTEIQIKKTGRGNIKNFEK